MVEQNIGRVGQRALGVVQDLWLDARIALSPSRGVTINDKRIAVNPNRILVIDALLPDATLGAGYPRAVEILHTLVDLKHRVTMYPLGGSAPAVAQIAPQFPGVRFIPGAGARGLRELLWRHGHAFDVLLISRPESMQAYRRAIRDLGKQVAAIPVIYDAEAIFSAREQSRRALFGDPLAPDAYRRSLADEMALANTAAAVMAVNAHDAETFHAALRVPAIAVSHCVSAPVSSAGFAERRDLLFVGRLVGARMQSPNVDSIVWFIDEVMPLLDRKLGTPYRLHLVGNIENAEIADRARDNVIVHGRVDDLDCFFESCRVFVAPTRFAAGLPLKVVEAMARGMPCVTTPLLQGQLGLAQPGGNREISAETFASETSSLYTDAAAWMAAREAGFAHVAARFSKDAFRSAVERALTVVAAEPGRPV